MAILRTVLNTILSLLLGFIVGYLTFCLVLWVSVHLFRPAVVVDNAEHPAMPIAQIMFSFIVAITVGVLALRGVYTRIRKR